MNVKDFIELVDRTPVDPGIPPIPAPDWTDSLLAEQLCACFRGSQHDLYQSFQSLKFELTFRIRCEGLDPVYLHTLLRMHWVGATNPREGAESAANWPRAIALARVSLVSKPPTDEPWMHLYDRHGVVCGHAAFIQSLGFKLTVLGMHIVPVEPDSLAQYIQNIAAEIGGKALMRALRGEMLVNTLSGRYVFIRRPSVGIGTPEADLPWNYLYHLAAKLWSTEPRTPNMARWDELKRVATAYAALINVQPYHVFEGINIAVAEMLRHMHSVAVYDAIFTIDQMQPRAAVALLEGVLHHVDGQRRSPTGIPLKSVLRVARYMLETASQSQDACTFSASRIAEDLKMRRENVVNVLNAVFAYVPTSINTNFGEITEFRRANFWNRPLIAETPEIYVLVDPRLCAPAMLHAVFLFVYKYCLAGENSTGKEAKEKTLGRYTEQYLRSIISRAGVAVQHGKFEYATTENRSSIKGECDAVVETPSTIYFIEVKNKVLTAPARSGEIVDLAKDLSQGMLHACLQAFSHAQLLKQHQRMDLEHDGETYHLQLQGRRVEAVAMSLADLGGFQDRTALHEFLRLYVRGEIRADTPQTQALFAEQTEYAGRLRRLVAEMPEEEQRLPFFNCHFMSLPQLMTMLQHVSNPADFDHEMGRMRHQTMGTQDWYYEYNVSRQRDLVRV